MLSYLIIGICLFLLVAVIYFCIKPITMGIEARRNIKETNKDEDTLISTHSSYNDVDNDNLDKNISDEILKLKKLKDEGVINQDEFEMAKKKIIELSRFYFFFYKFWHFIFFIKHIFLFTFRLKDDH